MRCRGADPEKTRRRAEQFRARPYFDIAEMLERERPDLVSICLPGRAFRCYAAQVIQAGFPLLVEKPLVFELEEADRLLRKRRSGTSFLLSTSIIATRGPFRHVKR